MTYNPDIHHRRSIRLREYDYSSGGVYSLTMCVHGRECLFGAVADGFMHLNEAGRMVEEIWRSLAERFPNVTTDEFIVMPNHVHGIIIITDAVGAPLAAPMIGLVENKQGAASSALTRVHFMIDSPNSIMISALEHSSYCPRQCAQWAWCENFHNKFRRHP